MNSRIQALLEGLSVLPDHSPEWLENPSVRVDLHRAVIEARSILAKKPAVKYFVLTREAGAASGELSHEELWRYLQAQANHPANVKTDWQLALNRVQRNEDLPGEVIAFPHGLIFVLTVNQASD